MNASIARFSATRKILVIVVLFLLCGTIAAPQSIQAASNGLTGPSWVVVASQETVEDPVLGQLHYNAIYMVNTGSHVVHGPFLMNELTPLDDSGKPLGGDAFDVAVTPDGKTALISSFTNQLIYFVDISEPLAPLYLSSLKIDIYAEDLAITADGRYALVTDGGFSKSVYSIDILERALSYELVVPTIGYDDGGLPIYGLTNAVAVAPDGTVVMADYFNGAIHALKIGESGTLTYYGTYRYYLSELGEVSMDPLEDYYPMRPVNVAIAPDGKTVLVSDSLNYTSPLTVDHTNQFGVGVYKITAPGRLEFVEVITGLSHAMQTITFNEAGDQAIMLGNNAMIYDYDATPSMIPVNDSLYVMDILAPGEVEFNPGKSADLLRHTDSQLFGVDGLAVYGGKAFASYPTISIDFKLYPTRYLSIVDLGTFEVSQVEWGPSYVNDPIGLAAIPFTPFQIYLPVVEK